jgi:peptidoglycan biosynthesis protein MviN/MurJ (putative lipid II flippase)
MLFKYFLLWFPMTLIAILNGALRELAYQDAFGELAAHQVSTLTGIILLGVYMWLVSRRWKLTSSRQAVLAGLLWALLTIAFEFGFGHYVMHHAWEKLWHDYNLLEGRLWLFVLIWIGAAPYTFYQDNSSPTD